MVAGLLSIISALGLLLIFAFLLALVFGVGMLFSGFIISAAPLAIAILAALSSYKYSGWLVFIFWFVVLYSLASYKKLRKAITFTCVAIASSVTIVFVTFFANSILPTSVFWLAFIKLCILLSCSILALVIDKEKEDPFCINIARYIHLPMIVQRILASYIYGTGAAAMIRFAFGNDVKSPFVIKFIIGWGCTILVGIIAYYVDAVRDGNYDETKEYLRVIKKVQQSVQSLLRKIEQIDLSEENLSMIRRKYFSNKDNID